jgi:flavin-dependent dehydrogenase
VLLAGDAASLINPLSGEGIYYALASGRLAARAALTAPEDPVAAYRRLLAGALGRHLRHASVLAGAIRSRALAEAGLGAAASSPALFDTLVELGLGQARITGRLLAALPGGLLAARRATRGTGSAPAARRR